MFINKRKINLLNRSIEDLKNIIEKGNIVELIYATRYWRSEKLLYGQRE